MYWLMLGQKYCTPFGSRQARGANADRTMIVPADRRDLTGRPIRDYNSGRGAAMLDLLIRGAQVVLQRPVG
jgi:hypothetical protein